MIALAILFVGTAVCLIQRALLAEEKRSNDIAAQVLEILQAQARQ